MPESIAALNEDSPRADLGGARPQDRRGDAQSSCIRVIFTRSLMEEACLVDAATVYDSLAVLNGILDAFGRDDLHLLQVLL